MSWLPEKRTEKVFSDYKAGYNERQAVAEASRCLYCFDPPCVSACPSAVDVPTFIRKISTGNLKGAARVIFEENPLAMSCARVCPVEVLCAGHCVLNDAGRPPVEIGRLQRFVADTAFAEGWRLFERAPESGKRIALVGAGPASLACAWELARAGHDCVIFEQRPIPGGLNTTGIAPYKMRADRALEEVDWILSLGGIELRCDVEVGEDLSLASLEEDFDAVFMGIGLGPDRWMSRVPGADLPGILGGVQFIEQIKTSEVDLDGVRSAVVIGGGNTAVDLSRELQGIGLENVHLVYRRREDDMKGYAHEWSVARRRGAQASWRSLPVAFEGEGKLERVRCVRLDENLQTIPGSEFVIEAERAFVAIGQSRLGELVKELGDIQVEEGRVLVDEDGFTGRAGWYAGGDCVNGGKEVVNAAADGKAAARAISATFSANDGGDHA